MPQPRPALVVVGRDDRRAPAAGGGRTTSARPVGCRPPPRGAVAGTSSTTRSAAASTAGRWATTTTRLRCGEPGRGCRGGPARSPRRGGRSARRGARPGARRARRGPARRGPAGRRTGRHRPRRAACRGRGQGAHDVGEADRCAGPPTPRRRWPRGGRSARCRRRCRRAATVAAVPTPTRLRHQPGSRSASGVPPTRTSPADGASSPRSVARSVDLPQPDGPAIATRPRSGRLEVERTGQGSAGAT